MMLVINKKAMMSYPIPAIVNLYQLATCSIFVFVIGFLGIKTDRLQMDKMKPCVVLPAAS